VISCRVVHVAVDATLLRPAQFLVLCRMSGGCVRCCIDVAIGCRVACVDAGEVVVELLSVLLFTTVMHVVAAATRCCVLSRACAVDSCSCWHAVVSPALMPWCGGSVVAGSVVCDSVSCVVAQVSESSRRVSRRGVCTSRRSCCDCEAVGLQCIW
jgi:hypothetical protein